MSPQARCEGYGSVLTGSVLSTLLDAGLVFLLRFALDDSVEGVMSQAVHALKALLVCTEDEVRSDYVNTFFHKDGEEEEEEDIFRMPFCY